MFVLLPTNYMPLYHEEGLYITRTREKLEQEGLSKKEILELISKFEEMLEMNAVTIKIIDKLMINYDRLKREIVEKQP